ncbi:MAG: hypothetical protein F6K23_19255 [Okeania sp. SIO2C9]|uniref:hypothetical protein n=1 Tax=Okeania sp. SIO2C9 TaxID=2607791 RepID=UPI0013BFCB2C|nr:hypothetical protein [Okeania sp. SIO2C9]NEQ74986.1 hypothetical protein [Okeania sp. SIO2C9]
MGGWGDGEMGGWGDGEMGRWGVWEPTPNPSGGGECGETEKDLAMAHRLGHFFILNPSRFDIMSCPVE